MPDQTTRLITLTNCHWGAYDHIISTGLFTPEKLIEMALNDASILGISFEEMLADGIAHIDSELARSEHGPV